MLKEKGICYAKRECANSEREYVESVLWSPGCEKDQREYANKREYVVAKGNMLFQMGKKKGMCYDKMLNPLCGCHDV